MSEKPWEGSPVLLPQCAPSFLQARFAPAVHPTEGTQARSQERGGGQKRWSVPEIPEPLLYLCPPPSPAHMGPVPACLARERGV